MAALAPFAFYSATDLTAGLRRGVGPWVVTWAAVCGGQLAMAQQMSETRQGLLVTPRISISERFTDNAKLTNVGRRSEFVTQISPGINIRSNNSRLKGSLDYSLNGLYYANGTSGNTLQNALTTAWVLEAVDNWAFVDFSGSIARQNVSAFGVRTVDALADNANSTEVASFRLSPYLRGQLGGLADYEARLNFISTRADSAGVSDQRSRGGSVRLGGRSSGPLNWGVDASSDRMRYSLGRSLDNDQLVGRLVYTLNPQVNAFVSLGRESNNFSSVNKEGKSFSGIGLNWTPSLRTKFSANVENHAYGSSHGLSFVHSTARTIWRFSDSQSVTKPGAQSGTAAVGTLASLLDSQFAVLEPDPLRRAALVSNYLLANGYNPNTVVLSNFLASSASLQRRQEIAFSLLGVRDTINFAMSRGSIQRLSSVLTAFDDLRNVDHVDQSGFTLSYAHRLTPDAGLNIAFSRQNTASSGGLTGTSLRSFDVILSSRLGRQTFGSIGARRAFFDSATAPYTETSLTGSLTLQF